MIEVSIELNEGDVIHTESNTYKVLAIEDGVIRVHRPSAGEVEYTPEELAMSLNYAGKVEMTTEAYRRGDR